MSNEDDCKLVHIYCYKKRVFDGKLVLIGEVFHYEGEDRNYFAPWNPKIVGVEQVCKNTYYPDFYDREGNELKVDSHAYEVQLYVKPPSDNFLLNVGNLPLTIGTIDTESPDINSGIYMTYWDNLFYQPEAFIYRVDDTHHSEVDKTTMNTYLPGFYILEHEITKVEVKLFWPDCHEVFHPLVSNTNEVVGLRYGYTGAITYYDQFLIESKNS